MEPGGTWWDLVGRGGTWRDPRSRRQVLTIVDLGRRFLTQQCTLLLGRPLPSDPPGCAPCLRARKPTRARRKRAAEFGLPIPEGELDF